MILILLLFFYYLRLIEILANKERCDSVLKRICFHENVQIILKSLSFYFNKVFLLVVSSSNRLFVGQPS